MSEIAPMHGLRSRRYGTALAAVAGLVSGALGAYSYYDPLLRPIAHTLGLWLVVVIVVAAGMPQRSAMRNATVALLVAVLAFYVGKKVMYAVRYPGMPYSLDYREIGLWLVLAVVAGSGLGWLVHRIGGTGWPAAAVTAIAAGLLLGDAVHRGFSYPDDIPVTAVITVLGLAVLVVLTHQDRRRQLVRAALLTVPATVGAVLVVAAPDVIEQLVLVGSS